MRDLYCYPDEEELKKAAHEFTESLNNLIEKSLGITSSYYYIELVKALIEKAESIGLKYIREEELLVDYALNAEYEFEMFSVIEALKQAENKEKVAQEIIKKEPYTYEISNAAKYIHNVDNIVKKLVLSKDPYEICTAGEICVDHPEYNYFVWSQHIIAGLYKYDKSASQRYILEYFDYAGKWPEFLEEKIINDGNAEAIYHLAYISPQTSKFQKENYKISLSNLENAILQKNDIGYIMRFALHSENLDYDKYIPVIDRLLNEGIPFDILGFCSEENKHIKSIKARRENNRKVSILLNAPYLENILNETLLYVDYGNFIDEFVDEEKAMYEVSNAYRKEEQYKFISMIGQYDIEDRFTSSLVKKYLLSENQEFIDDDPKVKKIV